MSNPEDLLYSASHEWAKVSGDEAVLGITHFAVSYTHLTLPTNSLV